MIEKVQSAKRDKSFTRFFSKNRRFLGRRPKSRSAEREIPPPYNRSGGAWGNPIKGFPHTLSMWRKLEIGCQGSAVVVTVVAATVSAAVVNARPSVSGSVSRTGHSLYSPLPQLSCNAVSSVLFTSDMDSGV